jgi:hypothetical protein
VTKDLKIRKDHCPEQMKHSFLIRQKVNIELSLQRRPQNINKSKEAREKTEREGV